MGSHLIDGKFQSDKYTWCQRGFVPLKTSDKDAQPALWGYAQAHRARDPEFSADLETALKNDGYVPPTPDGTTHESGCCYTPSELRAEAEKMCPCDNESCGVVVKCQDHPRAPVFAKYLKNKHSITFVCADCDADLPTIHLDDREHAQ